MKTNAARILDGLKIKYELREYESNVEELSAVAVAAKIDMPVNQVFKTLVVRGDKSGVMQVCIPGDKELNLKYLAASSGNKKVEMVPLKDVQPLTGYIRGGVSPLGAKKKYPIYIDESALDWSSIAVSAGVRGCQLVLAPADLVAAVGAISGAFGVD